MSQDPSSACERERRASTQRARQGGGLAGVRCWRRMPRASSSTAASRSLGYALLGREAGLQVARGPGAPRDGGRSGRCVRTPRAREGETKPRRRQMCAHPSVRRGERRPRRRRQMCARSTVERGDAPWAVRRRRLRGDQRLGWRARRQGPARAADPRRFDSRRNSGRDEAIAGASQQASRCVLSRRCVAARPGGPRPDRTPRESRRAPSGGCDATTAPPHAAAGRPIQRPRPRTGCSSVA